MITYEIGKNYYTGEEGSYKAYGITAEQGLLSVTVNDITTEFDKVTEYVDRLKASQIHPNNLLDTIADYIDREE